MARGSNIITHKLRGKLGHLQFVNDPRLGEYVRVKRGTLRPAVLNEACKASSARLAVANLPAKAIYDAVRQEHKGYYLWNNLLSVFRRQLKAGVPFHLGDLRGLECHDQYTLAKLMNGTEYQLRVTERDQQLRVDLTMERHPDWSYLDWKRAFQYRLSVIAVFPHLHTGQYQKEAAHGPITSFQSAVMPLQLDIPLRGTKGPYLLFLLAATSEDGEPGVTRTKGMGVVEIGVV